MVQDAENVIVAEQQRELVLQNGRCRALQGSSRSLSLPWAGTNVLNMPLFCSEYHYGPACSVMLLCWVCCSGSDTRDVFCCYRLGIGKHETWDEPYI